MTVRVHLPALVPDHRGRDRYTVSVSRRGEMNYSFTDLKAGSVSLQLG